ncbi:beta-hexosaminidase [Klebsormidium nitens]|uniref:Beta-hexosaminidase n=1 Tax=Klebsormidium nitens TaxID=105231 RepID=A0A0U9HL00_KLENI|nr:beta-hexosaminidase [Klebsormidium nitens]|eukprot:GAQ81841.1 beta-hexosaminidase [Klebsormidium nitens]
MAFFKLRSLVALLSLHCFLVGTQCVQEAGRGLSRTDIAGQWSILEPILKAQEESFIQAAPLDSNEVDEHSSLIWPLPLEHSRGNVTLVIDPGLKFTSNLPNSVVLDAAFDRYLKLIFTHPTKVKDQKLRGNLILVLSEVHIEVNCTKEELNYGVDESYTLDVPKNGDPAIIKAETVFGALRGLETFSQLCFYDFSTKKVRLEHAPWSVKDAPRFPHRGLLIDTSRHWQPVIAIKEIIDSLSYAKMNVLHWHTVDYQSFPLEVPSFPKLWDGAYTRYEKYSYADVADVVEYGRLRGVHVMAEIDVPGHAISWGVGYPELWPSPTCQEPLDVSNNFTFEVIEGIFSDLKKILKYDLFHLGGDEVNTDCWTSTPHVAAWLAERGWSGHDAYADFVLHAQRLALKQGWQPINWQEPFDEFPERLDNSSIVHIWINKASAPRAAALGHRVLMSNFDAWYLDHLGVPWQTMYSNDILQGVEDPEQQKLFLGGEVCAWGETIDISDLQQTVWPRSAAAAERLWSPKSLTDGDPNRALGRLEYFRCLLNSRGVRAAPVQNILGRQPPTGPGSCFAQK